MMNNGDVFHVPLPRRNHHLTTEVIGTPINRNVVVLQALFSDNFRSRAHGEISGSGSRAKVVGAATDDLVHVFKFVDAILRKRERRLTTTGGL